MMQKKQFTRARLVLTVWYSLVLLIILIAFSVTLYAAQNNDVARIVLRRDFGASVPRALSNVELRTIREQVRELRSSFRLNLLFIDCITLAIGAVLGYFLAGKTLEPIRRTLESQKAFLADASHELRSPIAAIQTACEVVLRSPHKTKEDFQQVVEQTRDENARLGRMVQDLLLLSRLDTDESSKLLRPCSLSQIAHDGVNVLRPVLLEQRRHIKITIDEKVTVRGDADKLKQLIIILLDNAIKYTTPSGNISLTVSKEPRPQITVTDTGVGIPIGKQKDIFKRFYQADTSRSGQGTGLGLAIADSIMRLHNGTIRVISKEHEGSTFICEFPRTNRKYAEH